ncbi:MAG: glycoside transferase family 32 [Bacteroidales bacterium]|jgi:mannosyltransferase OCH1-like enzyme|nr:glycoside transferase family 32 [Bacteroidales bacterium]
MTKVTKTVHQIWTTHELPAQFKNFAESWKIFLPDWEYKLWSHKENREFVAEFYPEFLAKYDSYPRDMQRIDAAKYLILKKLGGIYADTDVECLDNIEVLIKNADCVVGKEPYWHAHRYGMEYIVGSAFIYSDPDSDFINSVYKKLYEYPTVKVDNPMDILKSTGPLLLTSAYNEYENKDRINLYEPEYLYPIGMGDFNRISTNGVPPDIAERIKNAYAVHYFFGMW